MNKQSSRLIAAILSFGVCVAAVAMDSAGIAAMTAFACGGWLSAYLRRVADDRGIALPDEK